MTLAGPHLELGLRLHLGVSARMFPLNGTLPARLVLGQWKAVMFRNGLERAWLQDRSGGPWLTTLVANIAFNFESLHKTTMLNGPISGQGHSCWQAIASSRQVDFQRALP
jgi:hypothetical protein